MADTAGRKVEHDLLDGAGFLIPAVAGIIAREGSDAQQSGSDPDANGGILGTTRLSLDHSFLGILIGLPGVALELTILALGLAAVLFGFALVLRALAAGHLSGTLLDLSFRLGRTTFDLVLVHELFSMWLSSLGPASRHELMEMGRDALKMVESRGVIGALPNVCSAF